MLRKTIPTKLGIDATIWDLIRVEWNKNTDTIIALYGYIDIESINKEPLDTRVINLGKITYPFLSIIYEKIKESKQELVTPLIPAVVDEVTGEIITPEIPAVYKELNEFAGATKV